MFPLIVVSDFQTSCGYYRLHTLYEIHVRSRINVILRVTKTFSRCCPEVSINNTKPLPLRYQHYLTSALEVLVQLPRGSDIGFHDLVKDGYSILLAVYTF